ncbi:MAG: isochorismatase family protein [Isosphaerales bacterium]
MDALTALRVAMAEVDSFYQARGIFQDRFGFGASPALIVIDMAHGWTDPAYAGGSARLETAILAINHLLSAARSRGAPVIFTTSPYPDRPRKKTAADASPGFRPWDSRACQIDSRLAMQETDDDLIAKEHASAFVGTPLLGHLIARRVDTLIITGCSTSACVRATATDAKSYELRPIIVREAVQDRSELAHEWTLFDIQARFADVVSLEEALAYLSRPPGFGDLGLSTTHA